MSSPRVCLLALLLAGCQSAESSAPAPVNPGDVQRFCDQFTTTYNERIPMCLGGTAAGWTFLNEHYTPRSECAGLEGAVAAGRLRFDATAAAACLQLIRTATCNTLDPEPSPCRTVYQGLVPTGGACRRYDECADGRCDMDQHGDGCQGTCKALAKLGQPCSSGQDCAGYAACKKGVCTAHRHANAGEACGIGECREGVLRDVLFCKIEPLGTTGRCQPVLPAGAACENGDQCVGYLGCPLSGTCDPGIELGGACTFPEADCAEPGGCQAPPGMTAGTCRAEAAPDGTPCAGFSRAELVFCAGYCDQKGSEVGVCRSRKMPGESCELSDECPGRCDPVTRTCVAACAP
jgi:hypothetical protein